MRLDSGVLITPDASLAGAADVDWIRERHVHGATIGSACSGAVLLARAGLLDGLDATTHWACVDALRFEEAKHMLASGDQSVATIALEVGDQDAAFFGRLFRRKVAMTPAAYRRHFGALARGIDPTPPQPGP